MTSINSDYCLGMLQSADFSDFDAAKLSQAFRLGTLNHAEVSKKVTSLLARLQGGGNISAFRQLQKNWSASSSYGVKYYPTPATVITSKPRVKALKVLLQSLPLKANIVDCKESAERKVEAERKVAASDDFADSSDFADIEEELARLTLPLPTDSPFHDTDLLIFKDTYAAHLPLNGLHPREYKAALRLYTRLTEGGIDIKGSPAFQTLIKENFKALMTRRLGRVLLQKVCEAKDIAIVEERRKGSNTLCTTVSINPDSVCLFTYRSDGKKGFLSTPLYIVLAHELIHALNYLEEKSKQIAERYKLEPTLHRDFKDLEEQLTITGLFNKSLSGFEDMRAKETFLKEGVKINHSPLHEVLKPAKTDEPEHFRALSENGLRSVFNLGLRIDYKQLDCKKPKNLLIPTGTKDLTEDLAIFFLEIVKKEIFGEVDDFLKINHTISLASLHFKGRSFLEKCLLETALSGSLPAFKKIHSLAANMDFMVSGQERDKPIHFVQWLVKNRLGNILEWVLPQTHKMHLCNDKGYTLLHNLISPLVFIEKERETIALIDLLVKGGIDPRARNAKGMTALHRLINYHTSQPDERPRVSVIKALGRYMHDVPNYAGETPLFIAARQGSLALILALLEMEAIDVHTVNKEGSTLLHALIGNANIYTAEVEINPQADLILDTLLERRVDINARDEEGTTILYQAMRYGKLSMIKWLLEKIDTEVTVVNRYKQTLLHALMLNAPLYQCESTHTQIVALIADLIGLGVDYTLIDDQGMTFIDKCKNSALQKILHMSNWSDPSRGTGGI